MLDLKIRNAQVYDGTGTPAQRCDVGIRDGVIVDLGDSLSSSSARQTVDAEGLALMPGIVDNHTHYDAQVTWDPYCTPSPALGVTTAVIGN